MGWLRNKKVKEEEERFDIDLDELDELLNMDMGLPESRWGECTRCKRELVGPIESERKLCWLCYFHVMVLRSRETGLRRR